MKEKQYNQEIKSHTQVGILYAAEHKQFLLSSGFTHDASCL